MKKSVLLSLLLFMLFIFTACNSNPKSTDDNNGKNNNNDATEQNKDNESSGEENDGKNENNSEDNNDEVEDTNNSEEPEEPLTPAYQVNEENSSIEPIDDAEADVVLITIDDAPDKYALEMAKTLEKLNVNAIFFVNGHFIETDEQKETLKEIYEKGFVIGNHTYSHPNLSKISPEEQQEEIVKVNDMIEEVIGERPKFFRAPHGVNTDTSRKVAKEESMVLMNWTYGYDYFEPYMDKEKLTEAMISGEGPEVGVDYSLLKSGANLLMHDREWTNAALEDIIIGLRDKGYEMVDPKLIKTETFE